MMNVIKWARMGLFRNGILSKFQFLNYNLFNIGTINNLIPKKPLIKDWEYSKKILIKREEFKTKIIEMVYFNNPPFIIVDIRENKEREINNLNNLSLGNNNLLPHISKPFNEIKELNFKNLNP